jgi:hypothetical protein
MVEGKKILLIVSGDLKRMRIADFLTNHSDTGHVIACLSKAFVHFGFRSYVLYGHIWAETCVNGHLAFSRIT